MHHVGDRAALFESGHLRLKRADSGGKGLARRVGGQPALVEIARRRDPLVGRQRHDGSESVRPPACRHLLGRQRPAPDREVREADAFQIATFRAAAYRERRGSLDRLLVELVLVDLRLLLLAVVGDRHAFGFAGAVVGHRDERPGIGRKLGFGHDLEGLLGPGVDQVHRDPAVFHPDVPAAVFLRLVHAGDHRTARATARWPQPEGDAERLVAFEVAATRQLGRPAVQHDRGRSARPCLPCRGCGEREVGLLAEEGCVRRRSRALGKGQVHQRRLPGEHRGDRIRREGLHPRIELGAGGLLAHLNGGFRGRDLAFERREAGPVFGVGYGEDRRRVPDVAVHRLLRGVVEEGGEFVELALRERIELVIVADGAARRQSHPDGRGGFGPVPRVEHEILLIDRSPFARRDVAAVEAASNPVVEDLIGGGAGAVVLHEIARQLQDRELIERQIAIKGGHDPLPVGPHFAKVVDVDAVRVGVSRVVEPVAAAMFAPLEAREQ